MDQKNTNSINFRRRKNITESIEKKKKNKHPVEITENEETKKKSIWSKRKRNPN